jgi:ubiquinone/menaquinone biosynthesis C-methylase UbiE
VTDSSKFADHFSGVSTQYAASRPLYPDALFAWLAAQVGQAANVWDAGCGSGQASLGLASHVAHVLATDPSASQVAVAPSVANVTYAVAAERCPSLDDQSVDLVTVAQALHWFDRGTFYAEVARVLKPDGMLAVWTYGLTRVSADVDAITDELYTRRLGPYWPPERTHVEDEYRNIGFPYPLMRVPDFDMRMSWTARQFVDYLGTWSAVGRYRSEHGEDPLREVATAITAVWGDGVREVVWPLAIMAGRATADG